MDRYDDFQELSEYIDSFCPMYRLAYSEVDLPSEVILYEDENQIVISKADYEKFRPETPFSLTILIQKMMMTRNSG